MQGLANEFFLDAMTVAQVAGRVGASIVLGALVGWNRERLQKPAGLRTHIMVSLGATTFIVLALEVMTDYASLGDGAQLDPTRVIEGVVGGIGFLGAGTIIQSRNTVEGITTAATVWVAGAVGVACGVGALGLAAAVSVLAVLILVVLGRVEPLLRRDSDS